MPAILLDGVVVGKWSRKKDVVSIETFTGITAREKRCIEAAAEELFPEMKKAEWARLC